jgi:hypothetical protein
MRNVPEEFLFRVEAYFKPSGSLANRFFSLRYCSEYCVIQDYADAVGKNNYAACVAKIMEKNPTFDHEAHSRIGLRRGARVYQVLPSPYVTSSTMSSNKVPRMPVDLMMD